MIPGIHPALEQELVDLNDRLDSNPTADREEWLPRFLLDLIEVSLLLFDLVTRIGLPTEHTFAVTFPLTI